MLGQRAAFLLELALELTSPATAFKPIILTSQRSTPFGANRNETEVYLCHCGNHRHMDRGDAYRGIRAKLADSRDWGGLN